MKIYFDGTEVSSDVIVYLKQDYSLFGDSFRLGSAPSNMFELSIYGTIATPNVVTIYINNVLYATVRVESTQTDNGKTTFKLSDSMTDLEFYYNARPLIEDSPTGYVTTMDILEDICNKANLTLENQSFVNDDVLVGIYDNTVTARQYVGYIAELNGGYAIINESGNLELVQFDNTAVKTLDIDDCSQDMTIKDHHLIGRVVYDNGLVSYAKGTGETCYIQTDNPYIASQEVLDNIYDVINGFEFYAFSTTYCPIDATVKIGQKIDFEQGLDTYPTIAQCVFVYNGGWIGGYNLDILSSKQTETNKTGRSEEYKRLVIKQNLTDAELQIIAEKQVELTKIVAGQGSIILDNAYEGQLYKLSISGQMSELYPMSSAISTSGIRPYGAEILYPSSNLFLKSVNLMVDNIEYPLNCGFLNYMDSTTYDEIQYESGSYKVIRRVGIDSQGDMYALPNEIIESTNGLNIQVNSNSVIRIKSFNNAILSCVYLLNNYNTSAELSVATDNILQQVVKNNEVVAKINLAIEEGQGVIDIKGNQVKIQSDHFELDENGNMTCQNANVNGTITSNNGSIGGWIVDNNGINNGSLFINSNGYSTVYTVVDLYILRAMLQGNVDWIPMPSSGTPEFERYDVNKDGVINLNDLLLLRKMTLGDD